MFNIQGKKAVALYRVSTERQTSKEDKDIPAQRELVHKFIEQEELILIKEFVEGGVSGFKTKISERDAIIEIKNMADNKEFDVLVVYKSDRIGRTTDESPLVVRYLNNKGVRIFTTEGSELKTETQLDKLMTYLSFWQNETESIKISQRATDYHIISTEKGKYRGGGEKALPFGYTVIPEGDVNLKGKKIGKVVIKEDEAEIVKLIYKLSIENNMGGRAIAAYLNENGYRKYARNGNGWNYTTINRILNNVFYKGYMHMHSKLKNQDFLSEKIEELVIIPEEIWEKNQQVLASRKKESSKETKGSSKSRVLLSGLVYCGHCGSKMHVWANYKYKKDEYGQTIAKVEDYYRCKSKYVKNLNKCDGQTSYFSNRIDRIVERETLDFMNELSKRKLTEKFKQDLLDDVQTLTKQKKDIQKSIEEKQKDLLELKKNIPKAMRNEYILSLSELKEAKDLIENELTELFNQDNIVDKKLKEAKAALKEYAIIDESMISFVDRYNKADFITKKAILNSVIDRVTIYKTNIDIKYKVAIIVYKENSIENSGGEMYTDGSPYEYKTQPQNFIINVTRNVKFSIAS